MSDLKLKKHWLQVAEQYAPRRPMAQLADEFRVTPANPKPPLVHFALPISSAILCAYAEKYNLVKYLPVSLDVVSPVTLFAATERLSEEVEYELEFAWPFEITADCRLILVLYSNYTMGEKLLMDEDQGNVIQMVQQALKLDAAVRPKWYFDVHDPWKPDYR